MDGLGALERRETWGKVVIRVHEEEDSSMTMAKL